MSTRSTLLLLFALTTVTTAGTPMLLGGLAASTVEEPATPALTLPTVSVLPAAVRELAPMVEFTARLDASHTVEVRPRVSGHLVETRFQAGQRVSEGDVLFIIDSRWQHAEVERATAALEQARVSYATAEREHRRAEALLTRKAIASEEVDRRLDARRGAEAALAAAEAATRIARLELTETEVRAPISGIVSRALVMPGNFVSGVAGTNTVLATIVAPDPVHAYVNVDEGVFLNLRDLQAATPGEPLPVAFGLGREHGFPRQGILESFDNRVDSSSGNLLLRVILPNADGRLVPGLFGRVRLATGPTRREVLVPELALGMDQGQRFVLVVDDADVVRYRAVELGATTEDGMRVITEGLSAGERVVVDRLHLARPGMRVVPHAAPSVAE